MSAVSNKLSGGRWERTIKCGCGNCTMMINRPVEYRCPFETSKDAVQLWKTVYDGDEDEPETAAEDQVVGDISTAFSE